MISKHLKDIIIGILVVFGLTLGGYAGWSKWQLHRVQQDLHEATQARDSLALYAAAERAEKEGWQVRYADTVPDLLDRLQGQDTMIATLARDLAASRVNASYWHEVYVDVRGQVTSQGAEVESEPEVRRWTGELTDSLLWAEWNFTLPPAELDLPSYTVHVDGELVGAEGGDGRHIVFGRSSDPRVSLSLGRYVVKPPDPVVEVRCTPTRMGLLSGAGFLLGIFTGARAIR